MPFGDKAEAVKKEVDEKIGAVKKEVRQAIAMEAKRAEEAGQPLLPEEVAKIADDKLDLVKIGIMKFNLTELFIKSVYNFYYFQVLMKKVESA